MTGQKGLRKELQRMMPEIGFIKQYKTHLPPEIVILTLLISFLFVLPCLAQSFTGKCVGVTDGDTITVLREGRQVKVRLEGIDCPERGSPFSNNAKRFASVSLLPSQNMPTLSNDNTK